MSLKHITLKRVQKELRFWENFGKISVQPHTTLCIQFLNRENNDKNNTLPLGKQICFTIVWDCAEILPKPLPPSRVAFPRNKIIFTLQPKVVTREIKIYFLWMTS